MNCSNCGAYVERTAEFCPHCGFHVLSQRKAEYLSKVYYNHGLEKASVRDLSGAIDYLKQSLKFNKFNIQARNLLGLVYYETGEVVAALVEWVISKNLMPNDNLASEYIDTLQSNQAKLESINRTVNKYNQALSYCRQGHEDMAIVQLRKLLGQNPNLIKAYHLLALLQIREKSYNRARRTLKKAMKIDKNNTTTLRFLREVDEQTGTVTDLNGRTRRSQDIDEEERESDRLVRSGNDLVIIPPTIRQGSTLSFFITILLGVLIGAGVIWFLVVPAMTQRAYQNSNNEILALSERAEGLESEIDTSEQEQKEKKESNDDSEKKASSMENLMLAYLSMNVNDFETAADYLGQVDAADLSGETLKAYNSLNAELLSENNAEIAENGNASGNNNNASSGNKSNSGYDSDSDYDYSRLYDSDSDSDYYIYDSDSDYDYSRLYDSDSDSDSGW